MFSALAGARLSLVPALRGLDQLRDRRARARLGRVGLPGHGRQSRQYAGRGAARAVASNTRRTAEQLARGQPPASGRPRKPCAAPTGWPPWANSPPASRTNCAIRWAPSRRRRKCSNRNLSAENEVAREVAGFISTEVDRTNSLVTRFLQFARPLKLRPERADLAPDAGPRHRPGRARSARRSPSTRITRRRFRPFPFDAELMERVFYNLVLNAAQATPAGRRRHGEDARRRTHRGNRRDRPRRGHRARST